MKNLLAGAAVLALGATGAAAQQAAPTLPPAAAAPEWGIFGTPAGPESPGTMTTAQAATPAGGAGADTSLGSGFSVGGLYGYGIDDEDHMAGLNLTYDHGLDHGLALQLEQAVFWTFGDGVGGRSVAGLNVNFGSGNDLIPYVGANVGGIYGNGIDNSLLAGPEVGLKLGPLDAKVAYDMPFEKSWDDGNVIATVGLGIRF